MRKQSGMAMAAAGVLLTAASAGMIYVDEHGTDWHNRAVIASPAQVRAARAAALRAVGRGKVTGIEAASAKGTAFEVEVATSKGNELEVVLNKAFEVVSVRLADHEDQDADIVVWHSDD